MGTEISTQTTPVRPAGLALQSFDDAYRFAKMVSASDFAPKDFRGKPESCLLAIQHGSEVGLSPMQSLQSIAVINGRPTIWGDAALALVQSSPVCEYVKEYVEGQGDGLTAVCEAKRRGYPAPTVSRFSMADAKRAGLAGKSGPWAQYPERMLQLRARGFALRNAFADALRGLITAEEAQDYPTPEPAREPVVIRPKFQEPEAKSGRVVLNPKDKPQRELSVGEKARLAINAARSTDDLARLSELLEKRHAEGAISDEELRELVGMSVQRGEMLDGSPEDNGQEHFDAADATA
jgi:hypothetical protein